MKGYKIPEIPILSNGGRINLVEEYVSPSDLSTYFSRATCVVCPYVEATQSGVVLTACAFGKPVVATRTGGLPEYVKDGESGLLANPGDPKDLAEALVRLLNDDILYQRLVAGVAHMNATDLSWDSIADCTVQACSPEALLPQVVWK